MSDVSIQGHFSPLICALGAEILVITKLYTRHNIIKASYYVYILHYILLETKQKV
jgi:hypothetical protein